MFSDSDTFLTNRICSFINHVCIFVMSDPESVMGALEDGFMFIEGLSLLANDFLQQAIISGSGLLQLFHVTMQRIFLLPFGKLTNLSLIPQNLTIRRLQRRVVFLNRLNKLQIGIKHAHDAPVRGRGGVIIKNHALQLLDGGLDLACMRADGAIRGEGLDKGLRKAVLVAREVEPHLAGRADLADEGLDGGRDVGEAVAELDVLRADAGMQRAAARGAPREALLRGVLQPHGAGGGQARVRWDALH